MSRAELHDLVRAVLPAKAIPPHLDPADVLDSDFEPNPRHAPAVLALRELLARAPGLDQLGPRLGTSRDVSRFFTARIGQDRVESIAVVGVNARLNVLFHRVVSRGGVASCPVRIADLLRPILMNAAHGALIVHNHPSGDPTPSVEDIELTRRVREACATLDVQLVDHVVVTRDPEASFSFLDAGLLADSIDPRRLDSFPKRTPG